MKKKICTNCGEEIKYGSFEAICHHRECTYDAPNESIDHHRAYIKSGINKDPYIEKRARELRCLKALDLIGAYNAGMFTAMEEEYKSIDHLVKKYRAAYDIKLKAVKMEEKFD